MKKVFLILALVLTLVPVTALAGGVTVLVGAQSVSFGADIGEYYDVPPGPGGAVLVGLDLGIPLDFRAGRRTATDGGPSNSEVTYDWLEFGPRFVFGDEDSSVRGDWFLGVGSYDFTWGGIEFDTAPGAYMGIGIEETVSNNFVGRVEIKAVYWQSDTFTTDGASLNMALYFGFKL
jgi:hypothetical protein